MSRVAVFVDAGYLFAQGSLVLSGQKLERSRLVLEHRLAIDALSTFAARVTGVDLLRVYWYDGTSTGPTSQHLTLAHLNRVKLRLGFVNRAGQQKGVDSLIVTDMITLARNRAISEAVLLSGDEDLRVGVQQAQEFGVRVHLLGIEPSRGSQSLMLMQEADSTHEWTRSDVEPFLSCRNLERSMSEDSAPDERTSPSREPLDDSMFGDVAAEVARKIPVTELTTMIVTICDSGSVPRQYDSQLLAMTGRRLGTQLDSKQKKDLRQAFLRACENRQSEIAET